VQLSFLFKIRDEVGLNEEDTLFVARVLFPKSAISFLSKIRDEAEVLKRMWLSWQEFSSRKPRATFFSF